MTAAEIHEHLAAIVGSGAVRQNERLASHTSFEVGGPAEWCVTVQSIEELQQVLAVAENAGVPITVLGGGTNVVISDDGLEGLVVMPKLSRISETAPGVVRAEAGVTINGLVRWTIGHGLAGLEAWAGTPGTVGGAIYGNAHYGGRNIGEKVLRVRVVTRHGVSSELDNDAMAFGYDTSRLQKSGELLVWAEFKMTHASPEALRRVARASLAHRKQTQPLALPSAGCLFQNPDAVRDKVPEGIPASAGALIDRAGLKGFRVGGAAISSVHANFVVNDGTATASDVRAVAEAAREAVKQKFGVTLRDEVVYLGRF